MGMSIRARTLTSGNTGDTDTTENTGQTTDTGTESTTTDLEELADLTPAELLPHVNRAIHSVLVGGQSYRIGSRSLTRADLSRLMALRTELGAEIAETEEDSILMPRTYAAVFDRPR